MNESEWALLRGELDRLKRSHARQQWISLVCAAGLILVAVMLLGTPRTVAKDHSWRAATRFNEIW